MCYEATTTPTREVDVTNLTGSRESNHHIER